MSSFKLFLSFLIFLCSAVFGADYQVTGSEADNLVSFESDAKLEFVSGESRAIGGYFSFNPDSPLDTLYGIIRVDLRELKTGISLRDEHMRTRHLETEEFPFAYFELISAENMPGSVLPDSIYEVKAAGFFYLHGYKKSIHPVLTFQTKSGGESIAVTADFQILLEEYHIKRPKALFLKLAKKINVEVKFIASAALSFEKPTLPGFIINN